MVIEHMAKGRSLTAFAGSILKSRQAVYEWIERYPAFGDAVSRARAARVEAAEAKLWNARKGAEAMSAMFILKNAEPDEWRDVKHTEHKHAVSIESLSDAELYAIAGQKRPIIDGDYTVHDTDKRTSTRCTNEDEIIDGDVTE